MTGPVEARFELRTGSASLEASAQGDDLAAIAGLFGQIMQVARGASPAAPVIEATPVVPEQLAAPVVDAEHDEPVDPVDDEDEDTGSHLTIVPDEPPSNRSGARKPRLPDPSTIDLTGVPEGGWIEWDEIPRSRRAWNETGDVVHTLIAAGADRAYCGMPKAVHWRDRHGGFEPTVSFVKACASCSMHIEIAQRKAAS